MGLAEDFRRKANILYAFIRYGFYICMYGCVCVNWLFFLKNIYMYDVGVGCGGGWMWSLFACAFGVRANILYAFIR